MYSFPDDICIRSSIRFGYYTIRMQQQLLFADILLKLTNWRRHVGVRKCGLSIVQSNSFALSDLHFRLSLLNSLKEEVRMVVPKSRTSLLRQEAGVSREPAHVQPEVQLGRRVVRGALPGFAVRSRGRFLPVKRRCLLRPKLAISGGLPSAVPLRRFCRITVLRPSRGLLKALSRYS
jgi:hypothetical protein